MTDTADDLLAAVVRAAEREHIYVLDVALQRAAQLTESPIEALFLASFDVLNYYSSYAGGHRFKITRGTPDGSEVVTQYQWGDYRIDFAFFSNGAPKIFVECDGHDFHERTPEQAERDRGRDREYQQAGITIFRFTGRELWRDASAACYEVIKLWNERGRL